MVLIPLEDVVHKIIFKFVVGPELPNNYRILRVLGSLIGIVGEVALVFTDRYTEPCYEERHGYILGTVTSFLSDLSTILPVKKTRIVVNGFMCDRMWNEMVTALRDLNYMLDSTSMYFPFRRGYPVAYQYCCSLTNSGSSQLNQN